MSQVDEASFLRTIIDDPDNDTPRLVFADWLQERAGPMQCDYCSGRDQLPLEDGTFDPHWHCPKCDGKSNGYAEWAEFIRVGCEIEKLRNERDELHKHHGGIEAVRRAREEIRERDIALVVAINKKLTRERELLRLHVQDWIPKISGLAVWTRFERGRDPCYGWAVKRSGEASREIPVTFSRGFISSIRLPLVAFMDGEKFQRCNPVNAINGPDGRTMVYNAIGASGGADSAWIICPNCHGRGTIPGLARELFCACPLTEVVFTDKRPNAYGHFIWYSAKRWNRFPEACLHKELFELLEGFRGERPGVMRYYETEAAAIAALSVAACRYGRELKPKLDPLPSPHEGEAIRV